jgi:hypothetical protein
MRVRIKKKTLLKPQRLTQSSLLSDPLRITLPDELGPKQILLTGHVGAKPILLAGDERFAGHDRFSSKDYKVLRSAKTPRVVTVIRRK